MIKKLLRKRVQAVLKAAKIDGVKSNVFCRKSTNHEEAKLPFINIYPNTENISRFDEAPKRYKRAYEFVLEIVATHDDDEKLCDELDDIVDEIEIAMEADRVLQGWDAYDSDGNKTEDCEATSVEYDIQSNGSNPIGSARVTYSITYIQRPALPIAEDAFKTVESKWVIGDHGENKAVDRFDLPQE